MTNLDFDSVTPCITRQDKLQAAHQQLARAYMGLPFDVGRIEAVYPTLPINGDDSDAHREVLTAFLEARRDVRKLVIEQGPEDPPPRVIEVSPTFNEEDSQPADLPLATVTKCLGRGEVGDAELLGILYEGRLAYDHTEGAWYIWGGHSWQEDDRKLVGNLVANQVAAAYLHAAAKERELPDGDRNLEQAMIAQAKKLRYRSKINNVLKLASRLPEVSLSGTEWDSDPWKLGVANGTLSLNTGAFYSGQPKDYVRTAAPTPWQGLDAPATRWKQFLTEIFDADEELIAFVQRLLGYSLTGLSVEHVLPVLWGGGRNGKDTILETLAFVLGSLANSVSSDVLVNRRITANAATPHLYKLRFLRLAWVNETQEGARLNTEMVKNLTGGGRVVARPLYGDPITFTPGYLLMLVTNHRPRANADDFALWKRLLLIPFTQVFVDDPDLEEGQRQRDPHLSAKLRAEAPGILAWLVQGCMNWQRVGLNPPDTVRAATKAYHENEDVVGQFITDSCVIADNAEAPAQDLYDAYESWSKDLGLKPMSGISFGKRIAKRFEKVRRREGNFYLGVGILADSEDLD